jgi:hypothetical protein
MILLGLVCDYPVFAASVTPYAGQRLGSSLNADTDANVDLTNETTLGIAVNWDYGPNAEGEVLIATSQQTLQVDLGNSFYDIATDVSYLHLGGRLWFHQDKPIQTSVSGGLGASYFDSDGNSFDDEFYVSMHLALGARIRVFESIALRGDIRVFGTFFNSAYRIRCNGGDCQINMNSEVYLQTEVVLGFEYRF